MSITVYEKSPCPACTQTKKTLDRSGIEYNKKDILSDDEAFTFVTKTLGYSSAPIVVVRDEEGTIINHWSGFNLDELSALKV